MVTYTTSSNLEQKIRETNEMLSFKEDIYKCSFNPEWKFGQSQMALILKFPSQVDI